MKKLKDYYAILGIARNADTATISRACRRLMQKYHPDVCADPEAAERFKEVREAGRVLRDPIQRAVYDRMTAWCSTAPIRRQRSRAGSSALLLKGCDIYVDAFLSTRELASGATIELSIRRTRLRIGVPPNSRAGQKLRLSGRGSPSAHGGCGDLLVVLRNTDDIAQAQQRTGSALFRRYGAPFRRGRGRVLDIFC